MGAKHPQSSVHSNHGHTPAWRRHPGGMPEPFPQNQAGGSGAFPGCGRCVVPDPGVVAAALATTPGYSLTSLRDATAMPAWICRCLGASAANLPTSDQRERPISTPCGSRSRFKGHALSADERLSILGRHLVPSAANLPTSDQRERPVSTPCGSTSRVKGRALAGDERLSVFGGNLGGFLVVRVRS